MVETIPPTSRVPKHAEGAPWTVGAVHVAIVLADFERVRRLAGGTQLRWAVIAPGET